MKKIFLMLIAVLAIISCGKDKKEVTNTQIEKEYIKTTLILDAIYLKDDSIAVYYKENNYFNYDKPVSVKIKGADFSQRIKIEMPQDVLVENFSIVASTNDDQKTLVVSGISVEQNDKLIFDGKVYQYLDYFLMDESFKWDVKRQVNDLIHSNKYPPGIVGSEKIEHLLIR